MTIQSSTVRVIYNGNNSTVVYYPVTFVYAVSTEVRVLVTDANSVNTELTFGTDYTVDPSGVLTTAAWDDTHTVTVYRVTDTVQLTDYVENDKFPADTHEDALDKLTRICQEIRETLTRTLQVSVNAPLSGPVPAATTRFLFIDDAGQFAAITPVEALAELNVAAGIGANYTAVFANAAARAAATPLFIGQIGVQLDTTGLNGFYRGTALSAGGWAQVFLGPADIQGLTSARLLGRYSSGSGNSEEIQIGTGLNLVAGILSASASAPLATEIVGVTTDSLIGRDTAGTGNAELLGIGTGLQLVSGVLSSVSLIGMSFITASTNPFTFDSKCVFAIVEGVAGGAGGGGALSCSSTQTSIGNGGAGGGWGRKFVNVSALTTKTCSLVVGAAGVGISGSDGTDGGSSSYTDENGTSTLAGGVAGVARPVISGERLYMQGIAASQPNGSGWDQNLRGEAEDPGFCTGILASGYASIRSGRGGNSPWGVGGNCIATQGNFANGGNGAAATGYGAGGGGAWSLLQTGNKTGGNATPGAFLIYQFA